MTSDYIYIPTERTLKNWLYQFKKNKNYQTKNRTQRGKINEDVLLCLITTLMDYPQWSGEKRAEYLNFHSGIFEAGKGISLRTVNRIISQLQFQIKSIKFAPPARNTVGLMILRAFWACMVLELTTQIDIIFIFVDEAAVTLLSNTIKGRALIGVVPVVEGILSDRKLSILSCVVPGFGVISKWFDESVKGSDYAQFIREVTDLIRRVICTGSYKICLIHDNCKIHKTNETLNAIQQMNLTELPTVPYSPQLNDVVESYFGFQKKEMANFQTPYSLLTKELTILIKKRWSEAELNFTPKISERFYSKWIATLRECKDGIPLSSKRIYVEEDNLFWLRSRVKTYRKK